MKDKNQYHYFEISDLLTQFASAFDSIIINRYERDVKKEDVPVRFVYAPKQRVVHDLLNKNQHITVPVIAYNISGISRDDERVESKNLGHIIKGSGRYTYDIPQPVPINISISMNIITRYQEDMDQILGNFIPYTNPYIIISWKYPSEFTPEKDVELRSEVLWSGDIDVEQPVDQGESNKYRNVATTSFILKGWFFKKHPENPTGNIYEIDTRYYPVSSIGQYLSEELTVYDEFSLSSYPLITATKKDRVIVGDNPIVPLEGDNFSYTTSVYLSSDSSTVFSDGLSSYDNFDGIPLSSTEYNIIDDNLMYVTSRTIQDEGNISIIIENPSGFTISDSLSSISLS